MTTGSSTSITAAWQLPQVDSRNGIISGFKLFYRKKSSAGKEITLVIANGTSRSKTLTGLAKYTEYEFELLAFTSVGDGPKSSVKVAKTKEDSKWSKPIVFEVICELIIMRLEKNTKPSKHFQHEF